VVAISQTRRVPDRPRIARIETGKIETGRAVAIKGTAQRVNPAATHLFDRLTLGRPDLGPPDLGPPDLRRLAKPPDPQARRPPTNRIATLTITPSRLANSESRRRETVHPARNIATRNTLSKNTPAKSESTQAGNMPAIMTAPQSPPSARPRQAEIALDKGLPPRSRGPISGVDRIKPPPADRKSAALMASQAKDVDPRDVDRNGGHMI
jgi:hypothetical protein